MQRVCPRWRQCTAVASGTSQTFHHVSEVGYAVVLSIGFSWDAVEVQVCVSRAVDIFLCHTTQLLDAGFPSAVAGAWCSGAGIRYDFFDCAFNWMGWAFRLYVQRSVCLLGPYPRRVLAAKNADIGVLTHFVGLVLL